MTAPANGPDNGGDERERMFAVIAELREERRQLITNLANCRRDLAACRAELKEGSE